MAPPAPPATSTPATSTPVAGTKAEQGVRGQITAITATTWTVTTAKGKAFTVTVSPQTVFGTKAAPATAAQFPVGTMVRVTGPRTGATVTATRIALAKAKPARPRPPQRHPPDGQNFAFGLRVGNRRAAAAMGAAAARRGVPDPGRSTAERARAPSADRPILGHPGVTGATSVDRAGEAPREQRRWP